MTGAVRCVELPREIHGFYRRRAMNRREALLSIAGGLPASILGPCFLGTLAEPSRSQAAKKTALGVCIHSFGVRNSAERSSRAAKAFDEPLNFLEYCRKLGAGGVQVALGVRDKAYTSELRKRAEHGEMFVEGIAALPRDKADLGRFEAGVRTAKAAGADVIRVVMIPGRRYERFESAEQFHEYAKKGLKSLQLAEPVAARHHIRLAIENHKDQRINERLEVLKRLSSEYVGICVDTGNSIALLEEPMEVVKAYAPWAFSAHLKDMAVREYNEGFLLSEVPLGEGFLDLSRMVEVLRRAQPAVRFSLEMITRDPLRVPCLTEKYWATFPRVPGRDLAHTLAMVRANASGGPLPRVSGLSLDQKIRREEDNVKKCLAFAARLRLAAPRRGEHLNL